MRTALYLNIGVLSIALSAAGALAESKVSPAQSSPGTAQIWSVARDSRPILRADNQASIATIATTRTCAERDLRVLTAIEERGSIGDMPGQRLAEATFAMVRARIECAEGREHEALALYDMILVGLALTHVSGR
jgi:hypothetical protein